MKKINIYYNCTLMKFAEQLNIPLWKAIEFKKYFDYLWTKKYKYFLEEIINRGVNENTMER